MNAKNVLVGGNDCRRVKRVTSETNPPRPIITLKEARKILGNEYKNVPDDDLYRVIIEMERMATLLANNPEIFNLTNGDTNNE